ncbi:cullin homolog 1 [Drosophila erecta]|uniref:Cullin family profile domain-containing protein n=1 Tax=Drosophila erecta TaxID=7220 RepID=B3NCX9_DROER|nr:cullin homolog 1 [Drosophila erecta]EDV51635.2 uncharacterized protein Dere_GG13790 [Drosophila erecta]
MNHKDKQTHCIESLGILWQTTSEFLRQIFDDHIPFDGQQILKFYSHIYQYFSTWAPNMNAPSQYGGTYIYAWLGSDLTLRLKNISKAIKNQEYRDDLIAKYVEHWLQYQKSCEILDKGCLYINRNWVERERFEGRKYIQPVYRMAMIKWKEEVFRPIDRELVNAITTNLRQKNSESTKALVYQVLQSIVELYANDEKQEVPVLSKLENVFMKDVVCFYKTSTMAEFQRIIVSNDHTDFKHFLKYACLAMPEIEDGFEFRAFLRSHLAAQLQEAIAKSLTCKDYIQAIFGVRNSTLTRAIRDHKNLLAIVDRVCADAINKVDEERNPISLIVMYADELMRKKQESEKAIIEELKRIVVLVEFLNDKDTFIRFYWNMLRIRQIKETSASDGNESTMISLLSKKFGDLLIWDLRQQLKELELSRIIKSQFQDHLNFKGVKLGFDFRPKCFQKKNEPNFKFTFPDELQQASMEFSMFLKYHSRNERKIFEFNNNLSSGEISCHLNQSIHIIELSTFQMAILLLFNRHERITEQDMALALGVEVETLKGKLKFLNQKQLLIYNGAFVEVNMNFTNKKRRLDFISYKTKIRKLDDNCITELKIRRANQTDAAIARIMKKNRELEHSELISHVFEELKNLFTPQVGYIRERLEALLNMKCPCVERCKSGTYRYV